MVLLAGTPISRLMVEYPKPNDRSQPTIPSNEKHRLGEVPVAHAHERQEKKGSEEGRWIEQLF